MSTFALVFPGQGSQTVGMGRELALASPAAAAVFARADAALGEPLSDLAWQGPADRLDRTENAQPALLATSIAYLEALRAAWGADAPRPAWVAGHSMGQYSALVAAGVIELEDAVRLVRERGRLMQASGAGRDGAMAAILGLDDERVPALVEEASAHGIIGIANRNAPGQVVVSGERSAIDAAAGIAKRLGARKAIVLPVSVAAHSPLMLEAADGMRGALEGVPFRDPEPPLLANADGRPLRTAAACRTELVAHLTTGVDWIAVVRRLSDEGVTHFVEVGPGRVLTGLIKRIEPNATAVAVEDPSAPSRLATPDLPTA